MMHMHAFFMQTHCKRINYNYICIMEATFYLPQDKEVRDDILEILYHVEGEYSIMDDRIITRDKLIIGKADELNLQPA